MFIAKNGRLLWDEKYESSAYSNSTLANECINPCVSFDDGLSWMSLNGIASRLRNDSRSSSTIEKIQTSPNNEGFNQLDITFGFTPYTITEITKAEYATSTTGVFNGGTTYYFVVMNNTYEYPGYYDDSKDDYENYVYYTGNYYHGPVTGTLTSEVDTNGYYPSSKIYKLTLPGSTTDKYNVDLYVKYPDIAKGLCIYYGTASGTTITMNLYMVTNLVQRLGANLAADGQDITLWNNYPLPSKGTVLIGSEVIQYGACTYTNSKWHLTQLVRPNPVAHSVLSSTATTGTIPDEMPVYLVLYNGGIHGEMPEKIYPTVSLNTEEYDSCIQSLNFDTKSITDITGNTTPISVGTIDYSVISPSMVNSLKLNCFGVINAKLDTLSSTVTTALNNKGSMHFYLALSDFNNSTTTDPYVFYPYNDGEGLWMKISRFNLKPYIGFRQKNGSSYADVIIGSYEDYLMPSLTKNQFAAYCLNWEAIESASVTSDPNEMTGNMKFTYMVNGIVAKTFYSTIHKDDFKVGNICIGGKLLLDNQSESVISDSFIGYVDDWRLYSNRTITADESISITKNNLKTKNVHSGKVELNADTIRDYNTSTIGGSVYNNALADSTTNSPKYEPRIYSQLKFSTSVDSANVSVPGYEYGTYYDSWLAKAYSTSAKMDTLNNHSGTSAYEPANLSYPVNCEYTMVDTKTIKLKFDLTGTTNGFVSPAIKNIVLMVSTASLD